MVTSKLFLNHTTQAVRLPKEVAFSPEVTEVEILVQGDARVIVPKGKSWQWWYEFGSRAPADFMREREQPEGQERVWTGGSQ